MPWIGQLKQPRYFSVLEAGSLGSGHQHGWDPVKVLFPVLECQLLCPPTAEGMRELSGVSLIRALILFKRAPLS